MSADPGVDLIVEVLAQHRTLFGEYASRWVCACGVDGRDPDHQVQYAQAERHQAGQVWEALDHGAAEVTAQLPEVTR